MSVLLAIFAQTSILLVVALLAIRLMPSAAARVAVGRAALLAVAVLAIAVPLTAGRIKAVVAIPALSEKIFESVSLLANPKYSPSAYGVVPKRFHAAVENALPDLPVAVNASAGSVPVPDLAQDQTPKIWMAGATLGLLAMLAGHLALLRLRRRATELSGGRATALLLELATIRRPELRESAEIASPFLCGLAKPAILLPKNLEDESVLRPVLAHEVSHFNRGDVPWSYAGRAIHAVLWFQPLLWPLRKQIQIASEEICDAEAVRQGCSPTAYAECLVRLAAVRPRGITASLALGMAASRSRLSSRVEAILNDSLRRATRLTSRARFGIAMAAIACIAAGGLLVAPALAEPNGGQDLQVKAIWQSTVNTYRNLKSISFTEIVTSPYARSKASVVFVPSKKLRVTEYDLQGAASGAITYVYDGKYRYVYDVGDSKNYLKSALGNESIFTPSTSRRGNYPCWALQQFFGPSPEKMQAIYINGDTRQVQGKTIGGVETLCLETPQKLAGMRRTIRVYIGIQDHLIRGFSHLTTIDGKPSSYDVTYESVRVNDPVSDSEFHFEPPKGATERHAPAKPKNSPETLAFVDKMENASRELTSSSATFETINENGQEQRRSERKLDFSAPLLGKSDLRVDRYRFQATSDGRRVVVQNVQDPKRYFSWRADASEGPESVARRANTFRQLLGTGGYALPGSSSYSMVELSYCGIPSYTGLKYSSLSFGKPTMVNGEPVDVLNAIHANESSIGADTGDVLIDRFYVSKKDRFVRRYEFSVRYGGPQGRLLTMTRTNVRNVKVGSPLPASAFSIHLAPNAAPIAPKDGTKREWYEPNAVLEAGNQAPELSGTLLDGRKFSLADMKGKVVVLYAWTNGVTDMPKNVKALIKLQKELGPKGVQVVGLAVGIPQSFALSIAKTRGYNWPSLMDGPSMKAWNIHLLPFELVIDRNGMVQGKNLNPESREMMVRSLLAPR